MKMLTNLQSIQQSCSPCPLSVHHYAPQQHYDLLGGPDGGQPMRDHQ